VKRRRVRAEPWIRCDRIGPVTLYLGDALDVLPALPEFDVCITDPPYGEYTHTGQRRNVASALDGVHRGSVAFDSVDLHWMESTFDLIVNRCVRRWVVATVEWRFMHALEGKCGLRRFGIWVKPNATPQFTGDRPATGWEAVAICHRSGARKRWNGRGRHAVWIVNREHGPMQNPTQKPEKLIDSFVDLFSDPGETIVDPFLGSGTTGVCAVRRGRGFVGIERDEGTYCSALARIRGALPGRFLRRA